MQYETGEHVPLQIIWLLILCQNQIAVGIAGIGRKDSLAICKAGADVQKGIVFELLQRQRKLETAVRVEMAVIGVRC